MTSPIPLGVHLINLSIADGLRMAGPLLYGKGGGGGIHCWTSSDPDRVNDLPYTDRKRNTMLTVINGVNQMLFIREFKQTK